MLGIRGTLRKPTLNPCEAERAGYDPAMSASEIIEQIKALPQREREEVAAFIRSVDDSREVRYADEATFETAATRVFETHDELLRRLAK